MIRRDQLFPGVIFRVVKEKRGTLNRLIYFYPDGAPFGMSFGRNLPDQILALSVGDTFEVTQGPRIVRNISIVRVRRVGTLIEGEIRYGELHFHCEIVDDKRPKGRPLWERLDDELQ